jgi:ribosomal protein L12E/L44/L45/RPP1/RPP2
MSFKARLRQMKSRFEEARSARSAFEDLPDGRYVSKITKAYLHESESGKMFAVFSFTVIEGEEKGEVITDWNNLDHDVGLRIFCEKVKRLGSDLPDDPTEIENVLKEIAGDRPTVRLRLKTRKTDKGEFQGKNIERVLEDYDAEEDVVVPAPPVEQAVVHVDDDDDEIEEEEEEDEEVDAFSSGDHVKWSKGSGVIVSVDMDEGRAVIKRDSDGRKSRVMKSLRTTVRNWRSVSPSRSRAKVRAPSPGLTRTTPSFTSSSTAARRLWRTPKTSRSCGQCNAPGSTVLSGCS